MTAALATRMVRIAMFGIIGAWLIYDGVTGHHAVSVLLGIGLITFGLLTPG